MEKLTIIFADFTLGGIITIISQALGGWSLALQTLLIFIALDYISGILKALYQKKLNSEVGVRGIVRKIGFLIIVALANYLDQLLGNSGALYTLVVYFFVANEGISIVENWGAMDLPIPQKLKDALAQLKNRNEEGDNNGTK